MPMFDLSFDIFCIHIYNTTCKQYMAKRHVYCKKCNLVQNAKIRFINCSVLNANTITNTTRNTDKNTSTTKDADTNTNTNTKCYPRSVVWNAKVQLINSHVLHLMHPRFFLQGPGFIALICLHPRGCEITLGHWTLKLDIHLLCTTEWLWTLEIGHFVIVLSEENIGQPFGVRFIVLICPLPPRK